MVLLIYQVELNCKSLLQQPSTQVLPTTAATLGIHLSAMLHESVCRIAPGAEWSLFAKVIILKAQIFD